VFYAGGAGLLMIGITFFGGFNGRKRTMLFLLMLVLFVGGTVISCKAKNETEPWPANYGSYHASGLSNNSTYYWKVVADDGKGGQTASSVSSFTTQ
jgi:hypothetical protein